MKKKEHAPDTPLTAEEERAQAENPELKKEEIPSQEKADAQEEKEADVDQWREALEQAVKQRDDYLDSLRRTQADFQNFRRRNQTARSDGFQEGQREVIQEILPAIDNLERAIQAAPDDSPLKEGVKMTLHLLLESLKKFGLEEIPALGEEFDPEKHHAVMKEVGDEPNKVLEVFQKGYRVKDKIIRYAMVKVSVEE